MASPAQGSGFRVETPAASTFSAWPTAVACVASDAAALSLASLIGFRFWILFNPLVASLYNRTWPIVFLALAVYSGLGLYPGAGLGPVEILRRVTLGSSMVFLVLTTALFMTKAGPASSRGAFLASWILSLILVPGGRALMAACFADKPWWGVPVVILGAGHTARLLLKRVRETPALGLKPVACFDDDPGKCGLCEDTPVLGPLALAAGFSARHHVRHAIVAMPRVARIQLVGHLEEWSKTFSHVIVVPDLFGITSLGVSPLDLGGVLGLEIRYNLLNPLNRWIKRALDLGIAALALSLVLPLLALCVAVLLVVSPGAPFFIQEREGEGGRKIRIIKLRTMHLNAEELLQAHLAANPQARQEWELFCKLRHDPRILPGIGRLYRRMSLDELPQLWNVLRGQMSLVGPRPFPLYHNQRFEAGFHRLRLRVRPGLTGLWQISARSDGDLSVQEELDTYYIRNWSVWLDVYILVRTVRALLFPSGAY